MKPNGKRLALGGLALLLLASFVFELTVTRAAAPQRRKSATKSRAGEAVGDLFRNNCARCHGPDGRGDTPLGNTYHAPHFTDPERWQKHSQLTRTSTVISTVSRGQSGMPHV